MPNHSGSSGDLPAADRRGDWREKVLLSCVELGEENGGIVLNISQGGLALQAVAELNDDELPRMRFQFSQSQSWIEAKARIAWRSRSRKMAGVQFIDLSDEARNKIRAWISSFGPEQIAQSYIPTLVIVGSPVPEARNARTSLTGSGTTSGTDSPAILSYQGPKHDRKKGKREQANTSRKTLRFVGLLLTVMLCVLSAIVLGRHLETNMYLAQGREVPTPSSSSSVKAVPAANPNLPLDHTLFVLQVGAMSHQENAILLAESLRQKNFSVFVFKAKTDRLYRVLVGPYTGADSVMPIKIALEKQGYEAIRIEWKN